MTQTLAAPRPVRLAEWAPPAWLAPQVDLLFEIEEDETRVTSTVSYERNPAGAGGDLHLDVRDLEILSVVLDGAPLPPDAWDLDASRLRLPAPADAFTVQIVTRLQPHRNTSLEGLYRSGGTWCTQMEAEGFRRVTPFPDRPDVLSVYTTTLVADKATCPVLLAGGNLVDAGDSPGGRHFAVWHDPHRKPCYLFAVVAGDLAVVEDSFTTASGRDVALRLYVDRGNEDRTSHALRSLRRAMRWDEEAFGREYDLDVFMIVAVRDFNMGAMENKGLNLFNASAVLANPATATDEDFRRIEGVVGHEYFHNWSGNRVTCRDWFQLSLKEGLTVFRDQEFSSDVSGREVQRIQDVRSLRARQFPEDAGPGAHPVRPAEYLTIDNFYTATVYEKGAEVVRMLDTLLGREAFRRGTDLYFARHDGQAVTTDDFVTALADASGVDLDAFRRWYDRAGTPELIARGRWDAASSTYTLQVEQRQPPRHRGPGDEPLVVPIRIGLLGRDGHDLPLRLEDEPGGEPATTRVLTLETDRASWRFTGLPERPVPSLLRGFSAPVALDDDLDDDDLAFLATHDGDAFNRWEAGQRLASRLVLAGAAASRAGTAPPDVGRLAEVAASVLDEASLPAGVRAEMLTLPDESVLGDQMDVVAPDAVFEARSRVLAELARALGDRLRDTYDEGHRSVGDAIDPETAGRRALKNACLTILAWNGETMALDLCVRQLEQAITMTDEQVALELLAHQDDPRRDHALALFRERWVADPLVLDKWFAARGGSKRTDTVADVVAAATDPAFDGRNPNRVRALYRTFAQNPVRFHGRDGAGYRVHADMIAVVDGRNPILAARLASAFDAWPRYDAERGALMRAQLQRLLEGQPSRNLLEVVTRALG